MKCEICNGTGRYKEAYPCFACASKGFLTSKDITRNNIYRAKNPKKNLLSGTINKTKKVFI
tara:strand:+ start:209 stop:391 length:183 start_codon:yes stop_codon:yes gene_type:complete